jgi:AICAR transformylase/IMP cyclohydrolase PurH
VIGTGIKTIIEPGGVKEDRIVKKQLEENGIELIFSGRRRYKIS